MAQDSSGNDQAYSKGLPWYAPRIWMGCNLAGWVRLLVKNRYDVPLSYQNVSLSNLLYGCFNSTLGGLQSAIHGRRLNRLQIKEPPLFVLGHWRTGTTLLHELLILDQRHTYPTSFQCLCPNHMLLTEWLFAHWLKFMMPKQRPMDNMALSMNSPQEDEFALCNLGVPSPYLTIAFPNRPPQDPEYLDLEDLTPEELDRWKGALLRFVKMVYYRRPGRIVLKSPPHTCRIPALLDLFPDARFVHIVRDPYAVFPSTLHLWKSLYRAHSVQMPTYHGLRDYVFETFSHMYERFETTRSLINSRRLYELRYEDLVQDPVGQMRKVYQNLELGDFDEVVPAVEAYLSQVGDYKTNRYRLSEVDREEIAQRWGAIIRRYGYADQPAAV